MTQEIIVLTPAGRLDAAGARPLEHEIKQHIAAGHACFIVDLKETRYISSNGLRVLLAALKESRKHGGALKLCCLTPRLIEIFEMAGFDRVFEIYENSSRATKSFTD
ncbi:MAG: STAS domain-containing protein [Chloroflexi bacterium]|nr:STAS domain-containing protein [Chloroflexota bacterium]